MSTHIYVCTHSKGKFEIETKQAWVAQLCLDIIEGRLASQWDEADTNVGVRTYSANVRHEVLTKNVTMRKL